MTRCLLLGAERQAASSLALAYPERRFVFATDATVVDGWDMDNVTIVAARPGDAAPADCDLTVPLCPRWLPEAERQAWSLSSVSARLAAAGLDFFEAVLACPGTAGGEWQVKGDHFHRPDAPEHGPMAALADIDETCGCGLVYQRRLAAEASFLAVGRRLGRDTALGVLHVHAERFFRDDILQAAATCDRPDIVADTLRILDVLDCQGFFSCNWVQCAGRTVLTSIRPVPRAGLASLRSAGVDLLAPPSGTTLARPGICFVAQPHYASYTRLPA